MALRPDLRDFPDLSHHAFQHDWDSQATAALKQVPGLPRVIRFISENGFEPFLSYANISSRLRVNAEQYPSLYRPFVRMAQVLDVRRLPSLYIETTPTINAFAMGIENYSIVLCSGLIDIMDEDELMAVLGHELGHVKCEHQLYKTMVYLLTTFGDAILQQAKVPGLDLVLNAGRIGLEFALMDWSRKAELSCDRAALLATQNVDGVASSLAKLAGFSRKYISELNLDEVENQSQACRDLSNENLMIRLMQLQSMRTQSHPYPVLRVKEIRSWARSEGYERIVGGTYARSSAKLS
jgi:Zn-dependent protease with chaperone function